MAISDARLHLKSASAGALRRHSLEVLEFPLVRDILAGYAQLPISRELARSLTPEYTLEGVRHLQQETAEARLLLEETGDVNLASERDVRSVLDRASRGGTLTGEELWALADALELVRRAKAAGTLVRGKTPLLRALSRNIPDLRSLERELRRKVTSGGEVADEATPYLRELRAETRAAYQRAVHALESFMDAGPVREMLQERLITVRADRLVIPVKAEFQGRINGIVHDVSDSEATVFIEPLSSIGVGNAWRERSAAEVEETQRILRQLSATVARQEHAIRQALDLSARVDLALAKARYARAIGGVPVTLSGNESAPTRLVSAKHPLLLEYAVPISVKLESPVLGLVVTGPNTGGKTVALKTIGLMVLMHQAGLQPPVDNGSQLPIFDGVFADIGDQQSIEQAVSTFSSHMANIIGILSASTSQSLVLLDELGTGTDPDEGSALAKAFLDNLESREVMTIVTTHQRSVAAFAEERPGFENASVELDPETLEPTYRLTTGVPGRSYAITVAERLGLPSSLVQRARSFQDPSHLAAENLLTSLQKERHHTRLRLQEAEESRDKAAALQRELEEKLDELERVKTAVVEETRRELMAQTKDVLEQLRQAEAAAAWRPPEPAPEPEAVRASVTDVQRQLRSKRWGQTAAPRRKGGLVVGDVVQVGSLGFTGTVVTPPDEQHRVEVMVGNARVRLDLAQVRKVGEAPPVQPARYDSIQLNPDWPIMSPEPELDLRGHSVNDSLEQVDAFLDQALAQGRQRARIIHGKGTGALRQGIWKHLAHHSAVESFDYAAPEQGGEGATIIELA